MNMKKTDAGEVLEGLTIPENPNDSLEKEIRKNLPPKYVHGDMVIGWYRNEKKMGDKEDQLRKTYVDGIDNLIDLFKTYDRYIDMLKKQKLTEKPITISVNGKEFKFDPIKDFTSKKLRRPASGQLFVKAIGDVVNSSMSVTSTSSKYQIEDKDRANIRLADSTSNIMCWATKGYETTNKFIYQLWQNAETLGRGDVYGDPSVQTPYCTHSKEHWDDYSQGDPDYTQYWYLMKPSATGDETEFEYAPGDLTDGNVVSIFKWLEGKGPEVLVAMNDTFGDLLDKEDQSTTYADLPYGGGIETIDKKLMAELNETALKSFVRNAVEKKIVHSGMMAKRVAERLTHLDIPEGVERIGQYGLFQFKNIESISLPSTLVSIGINAFGGLKKLKEVVIPESVSIIEVSAFAECPKLEKVVLPSTLKTIPKNMFNRCKKLHDVNFPPGLQTIEGGAFIDTALEEVVLPEGLVGIGNQAFYGCELLKKLVIPSSVEIVMRGFISNTPLLHEIELPPMQKIHPDMFKLSSIRRIVIPEGTTVIDTEAFYGSHELEEVVFPSTLERIGHSAFLGCISLKSITIPPSVTSIGHSAFYGCKKLENVDLTTANVAIGEDAFNFCHELKSITIPDTVKSIGDRAFNHTELRNVNISQEMLNNYLYAFKGCPFGFIHGVKYESMMNESVGDGTSTKETKSDKFETKIAGNVKKFIDENKNLHPAIASLHVEHSTEEDSKYYSDVNVTNGKNNIWIEVKLNKYANLGGPSFKYENGQWTCSTTDEDDPLTKYYLSVLENNSGTFIDFCKEKLGNDFVLPRDLPDVMDAWKSAGLIEDTDNDVQFITNKIELTDFGDTISRFYATGKMERVYYIQIGDELYIVDPKYNPLALKTKDGNELKTLAQAHGKGRIQFRAKGIEKMVDGKPKYFYSIVCDVKVLADWEAKDNGEEEKYECSFSTPSNFPVIDIGDKGEKAVNESAIANDDGFREIPAQDVKKILDSCGKGSRYNRSQLTKYLDAGDSVIFVGLFDNGKCAAMGVVGKTETSAYYIYEVESFEKGAGKRLIQDIIARFGQVFLLADVNADENLLKYYRQSDFNFREHVVPYSDWGCPAHFFLTQDCGEDVSYYIDDMYSATSHLDKKREQVNEDIYDSFWYIQNSGDCPEYPSVDARSILEEFEEDYANGVDKKHWDLIPKEQYWNALKKFVKDGPELFNFPERILDDWLFLICRNFAYIETITVFAGHSEGGYGDCADAIEEVYAGTEVDHMEGDCGKLFDFIDQRGFFDWCTLPDGSDAWSDYGIKPIRNILAKLEVSAPVSEKIVAINKVLDVIHQRGDLASAFIEGGRKSCLDISNLDESLEAAMKQEFSPAELEKNTSFRAKVNYCRETMEYIGKGTARMAFLTSDHNKAIKLAFNKKGIAQNEVEGGDGFKNGYEVFPTVFDAADDYSWLLVEFARKAKKTDFRKLMGVRFEDFIGAIESEARRRNPVEWRYSHPFGDPMTVSVICDHVYNEDFDEGPYVEFLHSLFDFIGNYGAERSLVADWFSVRNWGIVRRDGEECLVITDSGLNNEVYRQYYGVRESILDTPQDDLDRTVWKKDEETGNEVLTDEAEMKVSKVVELFQNHFGFEDFAANIVGSICSNKYSPESDIDVHFYIGELPENELDGFRTELRQVFDEYKLDNPEMAKVGTHPIEVYIQGNEFQDLMSVGCYDILSRTFMVGPEMHKPEDPYMKYYDDAMKYSEKVVESVRQSIFKVYEMAVVYDESTDQTFKASMEKKLMDSLRSCSGIIDSIRKTRTSYSSPTSIEHAAEIRNSAKWKTADAAFKLLDRFGYTGMLVDFADYAKAYDEGEMTVDEIAEMVEFTLAKAFNNKEKEPKPPTDPIDDPDGRIGSYVAEPLYEAQARPDVFASLTPEQAQMCAKLSPSWKSEENWGKTSMWICSVVNRAVKKGGKSFDEAYKEVEDAKKYIETFEKISRKFNNNIDQFRKIDDLVKAVGKYTDDKGEQTSGQGLAPGLDGRARQCFSLIHKGGDNMDIVLDNERWLVASPVTHEYNTNFSAIGRWCHTEENPQYWTEYNDYGPLYYMLDKKTGQVLCASYAREYEIRDQQDDLPDYVDQDGDETSYYPDHEDWDKFWAAQPMGDTVAKAVENYEGIYEKRQQEKLNKFAHDKEWLKNNMFRGSIIEAFFEDRPGEGRFGQDIPGGVQVLTPFEDLAEIWDDHASNISFRDIEDIIEGVGDSIRNWDYDYQINNIEEYADTSKFNDAMAEAGFDEITFSDVYKAYNGLGELPVSNLEKRGSIEKILNDGGAGVDGSLYANIRQCFEDAAIVEMEDQIRKSLAAELNLGLDKNNWLEWKGEKLYLRYTLTYPDLEKMVRLCSGGMNVLEIIARLSIDPDYEGSSFEMAIDVDYDEASGKFDQEDFDKYLESLAKAMIGILKRKEDSPGQQHFDFDKDYHNNPENLPGVNESMENRKRKTIAFVPGSFRPPHKGHWNMIRHYSEIADYVIVIVSNPANPDSIRMTSGGTEITPEISKKILEIYSAAFKRRNIKVVVSKEPSPIRTMMRYVSMLKDCDVILGVGEKDSNRYDSIIPSMKHGDDVTILPVRNNIYKPTEKNPISATNVRNHITDEEYVRKSLPDGLSQRVSDIVVKLIQKKPLEGIL